MNITVRRLSEMVHQVKGMNSIPLLVISDVHYDSLQCDRKSLKHHLDQAKKKGYKVIVVGDWFDVMGCYKDPRTKIGDILSSYIQKDKSYLDLVVEDSYEFLKPYANNILMMSLGNHETAILKYRDTDPLFHLVKLLSVHNPDIIMGSYEGWLKFTIGYPKGSGLHVFNMHYNHGSGGGAYRSKGILPSQMRAMEYSDADLIVSGHDHNKIYDPSNVRERLTKRGKVITDTVRYLKLGSYKKKTTGMGYEVQKEYSHKRLGGWWVELNLERIRKPEHSWIEPKIYEAWPIPDIT